MVGCSKQTAVLVFYVSAEEKIHVQMYGMLQLSWRFAIHDMTPDGCNLSFALQAAGGVLQIIKLLLVGEGSDRKLLEVAVQCKSLPG